MKHRIPAASEQGQQWIRQMGVLVDDSMCWGEIPEPKATRQQRAWVYLGTVVFCGLAWYVAWEVVKAVAEWVATQ